MKQRGRKESTYIGGTGIMNVVSVEDQQEAAQQRKREAFARRFASRAEAKKSAGEVDAGVSHAEQFIGTISCTHCCE